VAERSGSSNISLIVPNKFFVVFIKEVEGQPLFGRINHIFISVGGRGR